MNTSLQMKVSLQQQTKFLISTNVKKSKLWQLMNLNSSRLTTNFLLMKAFLQQQTKFLILTDIKRSKPLL